MYNHKLNKRRIKMKEFDFRRKVIPMTDLIIEFIYDLHNSLNKDSSQVVKQIDSIVNSQDQEDKEALGYFLTWSFSHHPQTKKKLLKTVELFSFPSSANKGNVQRFLVDIPVCPY